MARISATTTLTMTVDGKDAVLYKLVPSHDSVSIRHVGGALVPDVEHVSVGVVRQRGDGEAESLTAEEVRADGLTVKYAMMMSPDKLATYTVGSTRSVTAMFKGYLFMLYKDGVVIDTVTIKFVVDGERGATLRGPQEWEGCAEGYVFESGADGEDFLDVVIYGGNFYLCKKSHAKTADNAPLSVDDNNGGLWRAASRFDMVATRLLLAEYALIDNLGVKTVEMKDADGNILCLIKDGKVECNTGVFNNVVFSGVAMKRRTVVTQFNFSSIFKLQEDEDNLFDIDLTTCGTWLDIRYLPQDVIIYPRNMRALCGNTILLYNNSSRTLSISSPVTSNTTSEPGSYTSFSLKPDEFVSLECKIGVLNGKEEAYFIGRRGAINAKLDN